MVLGNYYPMEEAGFQGEGMVFKDMDEAVMALRRLCALAYRVGITTDSWRNRGPSHKDINFDDDSW